MREGGGVRENERLMRWSNDGVSVSARGEDANEEEESNSGVDIHRIVTSAQLLYPLHHWLILFNNLFE